MIRRAVAVLFSAVLSFCVADKDHSNELLAVLLVAGSSAPCAFIASPTLESSQTTNGNVQSIRGKVVRANGSPAYGGLIVLDDATSTDAVHWSTYASVNRDGTFLIAGVPAGGNYNVAVEAVSLSNVGLVDAHLDCYVTQTGSGWYTGNNASVSFSRPATNVVGGGAGATVDIGTMRLLQ